MTIYEVRTMKALIGFIILGLVVLTLTEINERIKAKRGESKDESQKTAAEPLKDEDCEKNTDGEDCSACELLSVCEKEKKK